MFHASKYTFNIPGNLHYLPAEEIEGKLTLLNPALDILNNGTYTYELSADLEDMESTFAVFYLHGLGGNVESCREMDYCFRERKVKLIRLMYFPDELMEDRNDLFHKASWGDICVFFYNISQMIKTIANKLNLSEYYIVGHSFGGMVAMIHSVREEKCKKALLLSSSPDICDVFSNSACPFKFKNEAHRSKFGRSEYQAVWNFISPYENIVNKDAKFLVFNQLQDYHMLSTHVLYYKKYWEDNVGTMNFHVEFINRPELHDKHAMPPAYYSDKMVKFLFD